jgi:hypothetical protein
MKVKTSNAIRSRSALKRIPRRGDEKNPEGSKFIRTVGDAFHRFRIDAIGPVEVYTMVRIIRGKSFGIAQDYIERIKRNDL